MKHFEIKNRNPKKDTRDYILLQNNKMDFLWRAIQENPFQSEFFFWIDFGIQTCANVPSSDFTFIKNWESLLRKYQDKIHHLKISPVKKPKELQWKDYFQNIHHNIAGGFFGGSGEKLKLYIQQFYHLWHQILDEGWYQLDEAIMTILTEMFPDQFRFWYGDYEGILTNFLETKRSLPLVFNNIQWLLDKYQHKEADQWLESISVNSLQSKDLVHLFLDFKIQTDYYVYQKRFSKKTKDLLEHKNLEETWFSVYRQNLEFYEESSFLANILLEKLNVHQWEIWKNFCKHKNPILIDIERTQEFPFLRKYNDLLMAFRQLFYWETEVHTFYKFLEEPHHPIVFIWKEYPTTFSLDELWDYLKRNYPNVSCWFLYICSEEDQKNNSHGSRNILGFHTMKFKNIEFANIKTVWMDLIKKAL